MIKVQLEALDGKVITPRTGKSLVIANTKELPKENNYQMFIYCDESIESPGVFINTCGIESVGSEYIFYDFDKRLFKMTVLEITEDD